MVLATKKNKIIGVVAVSLAATLWGLDGIVLTPRLYNLDVSFVVFMLHLIPFIIMNLFLYKEYRHLKEFSKQDYLILILLALFGGALGTMAIVKALFLVNFQHLSIVVLLQKLQPVFAIFLAAIFLKEQLKKQFLIWAGIAIIASYFLIFGLKPPDLNTGYNTIYAAMFSLLAAFSFGSSTVLSKKLLNTLSFKTGTFYRYGFTTLIMFILVLINGKYNQITLVTNENWLFFILIGLTTGSGAIFLYYFGLIRIRAIMATICELFFPMSAILFDYLIHGRSLTIVQWIATIVMIFSIIRLTQQKSMKKGHQSETNSL
jgi:drug/metabolite transporter (DMT)-like permease